MIQVTEVLQVQLPGVLGQIDGVHILSETQHSRVNSPRRWGGSKRDAEADDTGRFVRDLSKDDCEQQRRERTQRHKPDRR